MKFSQFPLLLTSPTSSPGYFAGLFFLVDLLHSQYTQGVER